MNSNLVNLLLVDDRPENLIALEAVLSNPEYNLVKATSGDEALRHLLTEDFAAILLDVQMPGLDGFETAIMIKKREKSAEIPILFITALHQDELFSKRGYEVGGVDYIFKPFDPNSLRSKVAVFVNLHRRHQNIMNEISLERAERERKISEIEVETQNRFQILAEAIPQIVWTSDNFGNIDYFNRRWYAYTGMAPEESHGIGWLRTLPDEDRARFTELWSNPNGDSEGFEMEQRLRNRSGEYHWFLVRAASMKNSRGEIVKWFGTSTDIQEQKELEAALNKAIGNREDLIAIVSHDLKNPISAIQLNVDMAKRMPGSNPITAVGRNLERIQLAASRANQLIHDLLDLAKIQAGHLSLEIRPVMLCPLVNECIESLSGELEEKRIRLIREFPEGDECPVSCDEARIHQVLMNLLGNAIKFTPVQGTVIVRIQLSETEVRLDIIDSGAGIAEVDRALLFQKFWQARATRQEGSGLGLYISKGIIDAHHGKIGVDSVIGVGSDFHVVMPRGKAAGN